MVEMETEEEEEKDENNGEIVVSRRNLLWDEKQIDFISLNEIDERQSIHATETRMNSAV